jgi:hypothetical protein
MKTNDRPLKKCRPEIEANGASRTKRCSKSPQATSFVLFSEVSENFRHFFNSLDSFFGSFFHVKMKERMLLEQSQRPGHMRHRLFWPPNFQ